MARRKKVRAIIEGAFDRYVGSTQVHLIGDGLGAVIQHDGGRTALAAINVTVFVKSLPKWRVNFRGRGS